MSVRATPYTKIEELLTKRAIKVFTFQHKDTIKSLESTGYIHGSHDFSYSKLEHRELFERPYLWMRDKMAERIQNFSGDMPIWGWERFSNNFNVEKCFGKDQVKITAIVPIERCLISDFDLYEFGPMNNWFLSRNVKKMKDDLDGKYKPTQEEKTKSWDIIFDLNKPSKKFENYLLPSKEGRYLQICVDRIYSSEIKKVKIY